jgi:hypothetical protein
MTDKKTPKNPLKYTCKVCDFNTSNKKDYMKHLLTLKHKNAVQILIYTDTKTPKNPNDIPNTFVCECGKEYKHRQSLFTHKKKCNLEQSIKHNNDSKDELIEYLVKENKEIKELILELAKKDTYSHYTTNNNSHNKTFNLQFFLNETCKDAMNIMDFVNSIQLQLTDLESVGKLGFVEGISNIITTNLKALDVTQRPVHCTDKKRETVYVKDEDKWEKEDEEKIKLRKAIKRVATKNLNLLPKFKEVHPDCSKASSFYSDQYNKIIVESCGGSGDNDLEKEDKIIRNITKMVTIDKKETM